MRKLILIVIAAIIIFAAGMWGAGRFFASSQSGTYSAVYLTTGEVYFGNLTMSPTPHLTHVWILQHTTNAQGQVQYSVVPFTSAVWGPEDELYLNSNNIVFWTKVKSDTDINKLFANPTLFEQQLQQQNAARQQLSTPATTTQSTTTHH